MKKINVLQGHLAELIAAGEVVERPSSVIKELVENAIDAGASSITVEIKDGGITFMRVSDNGSGIEKDDIKDAFLRHATSKIATEEDLFKIGTLGFRGEALAAISSVCKVELMTKTEQSPVGYRYVIHGGQEQAFEECGCPNGTTFVIRDIFYNTPARMKFMKKDVTEGNAVEAAIMRIALSNPQIAFRFIRDGQNKLHTPGNGKLFDCIYQIYGREVANSLVPVDFKQGCYKIKGFVSKPQVGRVNRTMQHFYVNRRYVKTKTAMVALEQAYKNMLMTGKYPSCFLFIDMPYELVDVNVHPAKIEVRFVNENDLFQAVYTGTKSAVLQYSHDMAAAHAKELMEKNKSAQKTPQYDYRTTPAFTAFEGTQQKMKSSEVTSSPKENIGLVQVSETYSPGIKFEVKSLPQELIRPADPKPPVPAVQQVKIDPYSAKDAKPKDLFIPEDKPLNKEQIKEAVSLPPVVEETKQPEQSVEEKQEELIIPNVIGQLFDTYILAQQGNTFLLFDKHAAHERILFEQLKARQLNTDSQILLAPVTVPLSAQETDAVEQNLSLLANWGFGVDLLGATSVVVREIPSYFSGENIVGLIQEIASNLQKGILQLQSDKLDWLFNNSACRAAIKAGEYTHISQLQQLVEDIYRYDIVKFCPHGRLIVIEITKNEIEKRFGRV